MNNISDRFYLLLFETVQERDERRAKQKAERDKYLKIIEDEGVCEICREKGDYKIEWVSSMTAYVWDMDKSPEIDPNRDIFLCPWCAEDYTENMREMWEAARGQY